MRKFYPSIAESFEAKHTPEPNSGCWLWIGKINAQGYGVIMRKQADGKIKNYRAHIIGYRLYVGDVPGGLELDHKCRVRSCVNPAHLEPVTHQENCRRSGLHRRKEFCRRGHSRTDPTNIGQSALGERHCLACIRLRYHERRAGR